MRYCCDFRQLKDLTVKASYFPWRIGQNCPQFKEAKLFTRLDLTTVYWPILPKKDCPKAVFARVLSLFGRK